MTMVKLGEVMRVDEQIKGTSRGPEALHSRLNDSHHQLKYLRGLRWFFTKGRNTPFRPGDVPLSMSLHVILQ